MWASRGVRATSLAGLFWGATTKVDDTKIVIEGSVPRTCPIQLLTPAEPSNGVLLSRKIVNHLDKSKLNLRLYQYETCPFCCKVRAFLDYYGFSYEVVEVNPVTQAQTKAFAAGYKKVPVLRRNNESTMVESSLIISELATFLRRNDRTIEQIEEMYPSVDTTDAKGKPVKSYPNKYFVMLERMLSDQEMASGKEEREWREWVDDHFIHLISPNVYRTYDESVQTFKWFEKVGEWHRVFPTWERIMAVYVGAIAMFTISKSLKKRHNITDERAAMHDACEKWVDALGSRKFMGGSEPNLADLALYGAMNSFYGCAAFSEVVASGRISEWFERMRVAVKEHRGRAILEKRSLL